MNWLSRNWGEVLDLLGNHLILSVPSILISVLVAVPIGRLAFRRPVIGSPVLGAATLLYAIPALPVLVLIPAVAGLSPRSPWVMVIALSLYGIALLVRSAADAFAAVDRTVRQGALAVGYSATSVFWRVDLPLALPVLLPGIRVVTVSTISLVTIGALIGVPSLGSLLTDGFQRGITASVVTGIVATMVLALLLDGLLLLVGRWLTPWRRWARGPRGGAAVAG
jgi:osmoprotectant transport system permease protein